MHALRQWLFWASPVSRHLNVRLHQLSHFRSLLAYHVAFHDLVSLQVSKTTDFEVLRGLTNALLAAKKPDEVNVFIVIKSTIIGSVVNLRCGIHTIVRNLLI